MDQTKLTIGESEDPTFCTTTGNDRKYFSSTSFDYFKNDKQDQRKYEQQQELEMTKKIDGKFEGFPSERQVFLTVRIEYQI